MRGHEGWTPLPDGTRVRHQGQQYPRALRDGTAVVERHFWNGVWLEYVVRLDEPSPYGKETAEWSADHVIEMREGDR